MDKQSVVITGCDIVSKQIIGLDEMSECINGKQFAKHSRDQIRSLANQLFQSNYCRRMDDFTVLGLTAAQRAVRNAKLEITNEADPNKGTIFSTEWGPIGFTYDYLHNIMSNGTQNASPFKFQYTVTNAMCGAIARTFKCGGVSSMLVGCCPINYAYHQIQNRQAECIIVGAVDDYDSMLEQIEGCDETNSPTFSGAACIVMESEEYALNRNANIICQVVGVDSCHYINKNERDITQAILACDHVALAEAPRELNDTDCMIFNGSVYSALDNEKIQKKVSLFPQLSLMGASSVINVCAAICMMKEFDEAEMYLLHALLARHELNSLVLRRYRKDI